MKVLGVIGNPISHSLSPAMHAAAFAALGWSAQYVPCLVESSELAAAVRGARALGFTGLNVTIPYKESVLPLTDELTAEAAKIGAVNTIAFVNDQIIGHNTDGLGFSAALRHELKTTPEGKCFLVLGAGGAARAIVTQLVSEGAHVIILNRTIERAEQLRNVVLAIGPGQAEVLPNDDHGLRKACKIADGIINTTPVGMKSVGDLSPLPAQFLRQEQVVVDIIYNPAETVLLREAKARGCRTQNGMGMLVWQAAEAWKFWWGITPPVEVMYRALTKGAAQYL